VDRNDVERWVDRYVEAWLTNDPGQIAALFTEDAAYYTAPYREPWRGRDAIVAGWMERNDEPNWDFRFEVQAVDGDFGFVRGVTTYGEGPVEYSNLWVIRLDGEGRCSEFTEWWMEHKPPQQSG
jgi:ketosteroid isomerase-like protein